MQSGEVIHHTYRILYPIGRGGLGTVYLAYHENLQKYVVVKRIHDRVTNLVDCRHEADVLKGLHHRYLPQVYDFVEREEGIFTVMDYISGCDLQQYLDAGWQFEEEQLLYWLFQLCDVLEYLHTREPQILHCDIKPANIMITEQGDICLIDFNISLNGTGNKDLVGISSQYASPEQIRKANLIQKGLDGSRIVLDPRSDLYSLGAVFYRLMSGLSPTERRENHIRLTDMELPYSSGLVSIIDKCMRMDCSYRFRSAGQIRQALEHRNQWSRKWRRLTWISRAADGAFFVACVIAVCLMIVGYRQMRQTGFLQDYESYVAQAQILYLPDEGTELEQFYQSGLELLNRPEYEGFWERYKGEKANVLYCVAQAAMEREDYASAAPYLQEACELEADHPDFYRDLAVCQAAVGRYEEAESMLEQAGQRGLSTEDVALVKGQLAFQQGDYAEAYKQAVEAAGGQDDDMAQRASALALSACRELGNYEECLGFTQEQAQKARGAAHYLWLRKSGELCVLALEEGEDQTLLETGIACYEQLWEDGYAGLTELYNLAFLYERSGQLEACQALLGQMADLYPQEYEIRIQQAYICYRRENDRPLGQRNYAKVQEFYDQAVELCQSAGENPAENADFVQMEQILADLRQKGWLS